jgi:hypothetical protein
MNGKWLGGLLGLVMAAGICFIGCESIPAVTFETIVPDFTPTNFEGIWLHPDPESQNARIFFPAIHSCINGIRRISDENLEKLQNVCTSARGRKTC